MKEARSGLFPVLSLVGDYSYANPNPRILVSAFDLAPGFYGTWDVGVQLSIDIGAVPSALAQAKAAEADVQKARLQARKQVLDIILDVRTCALALAQARQDLELSQGAVQQARAELMVQLDRQASGLARQPDVLSAELSLTRARYELLSRQIDRQIAAADFARATGLEVK